jgi:hypothetical protein
MKMAKASKDDIEKMVHFMQFIEEFMEYGTYTADEESESLEIDLEAFHEKLRVHWGGRFRHHGVDCAWGRVVFGCQVLIDNLCDPAADVLEVKPEINAALEREQKAVGLLEEISAGMTVRGLPIDADETANCLQRITAFLATIETEGEGL